MNNSGSAVICGPYSIFKGKRVLVTGHTGFKGSWLVIWLKLLGADVYGYSKAVPTTPSNFVLSRVNELMTTDRRGDILDPKELSRFVQEIRPDFIFHLAAQPLVHESYRRPTDTFAINFMGTVNLLEAVRCAANPCVVVVVTSDKCYQNQEQTWGYREIDSLGGRDPYSASKACAEIAVSSYRHSFFPVDSLPSHSIRLASARAGNCIGGGDWSENRIVTDIIKNLIDGKSVPVHCPRAIRPWQHVLEPLSGYLKLAALMADDNEGRLCKSWNFGPLPGSENTVKNLVELFCKAWGKDATWHDASKPDAPHEAGILRLSIDQAVSELGWRPRWSVEQAVEWIVEWHRHMQSGSEMQEICRKEISTFMMESRDAQKEYP